MDISELITQPQSRTEVFLRQHVALDERWTQGNGWGRSLETHRPWRNKICHSCNGIPSHLRTIIKTFLEESQDTEQPHGRREGAKKPVQKWEIAEKLWLWRKKKKERETCPCCGIRNIQYTSYIALISVMHAKVSAQGPQKQRSQNWHNLSLIDFIWWNCEGLVEKTMIKYRGFIAGFDDVSKEHMQTNQSTEESLHTLCYDYYWIKSLWNLQTRPQPKCTECFPRRLNVIV